MSAALLALITAALSAAPELIADIEKIIAGIKGAPPSDQRMLSGVVAAMAPLEAALSAPAKK